MMYLLKKNEFIPTIIEKLKKARLDAKPENKKVMANLIAELQSDTDTVSWEEFEVRFQQVHTGFYTRLSKWSHHQSGGYRRVDRPVCRGSVADHRIANPKLNPTEAV